MMKETGILKLSEEDFKNLFYLKRFKDPYFKKLIKLMLPKRINSFKLIK